MMIVKYTGVREDRAYAEGWVQLIPRMEGLLVDGTPDRPRIVWRELPMKRDALSAWRLCAYATPPIEIHAIEVIGYATSLNAWKDTHERR